MTLDPTASGRLGRRAELRAKRRKQRRRLAAIGAAAVVALLVFIAVVLIRDGGEGDPVATEPTRTQRTVLLQVKDAEGEAVSSALLAHDEASGNGSIVLLPPQVVVTVPGSGSTFLGRALRTSTGGSRSAVEDLMGVTIDGSWVLDVPTFRRLVDKVGGVTVDVDVAVVQGRTVVVQPGNARLDGTRAVQFATYLAEGEPEQTRLARLQAVLDGIITSLPDDAQPVLTFLGAGAQSTLKPAQLADVLSGLKADEEADELQYRSLPVIKVEAGNDDIRFRIDADGTKALVDELLAQSVPPGVRAEGNRVLVLNGVGTPGLGEKVRAKLVPAGFVFVGSRNAPSLGRCCTEVLVKDATVEGAALGERVARALGVPLTSVKSSDQIGTIADVVVIVGKDFSAK